MINIGTVGEKSFIGSEHFPITTRALQSWCTCLSWFSLMVIELLADVTWNIWTNGWSWGGLSLSGTSKCHGITGLIAGILSRQSISKVSLEPWIVISKKKS